MHSTNLMRTKSFTEEVNCRHLSSENSLFVNIWGCTNVTFVKRLKKNCKHINFQSFDPKKSFISYFKVELRTIRMLSIPHLLIPATPFRLRMQVVHSRSILFPTWSTYNQKKNLKGFSTYNKI